MRRLLLLIAVTATLWAQGGRGGGPPGPGREANHAGHLRQVRFASDLLFLREAMSGDQQPPDFGICSAAACVAENECVSR